MPVELYHANMSAPCRTVRLTAAALGLQLELKTVDFEAKEHLSPEFLQLNPQHTIPTIVDDGFSLWESRAIIRYLANKYGASSSLYPQDPNARALVDQRLDFDMGTLYARFAQYFYPIMREGAAPDEGHLKKLEEALGFLNTFLEGSQYAAGPDLTLADLSLVATVSTIDVVEISLQPYPNVTRWYELIQSTAPGYEEVNGKAMVEGRERIKQLKAKRNQAKND